MKIEDPEFVATSGREYHAIVKFNGRKDSRVNGTVFEVSESELAQSDAYEPAGYAGRGHSGVGEARLGTPTQAQVPNRLSTAKMIDARDLMRLHIETLYTCDGACRLVAVNYAGSAPAPRFFLGRTAAGNAWGFRHDVDAALVDELTALCESHPAGLDVEGRVSIADPFIACLSRAEPVRETEAGPAFYFPANLPGDDNVVRVTRDNAALLSPYLDDWRPDVSASTPMFAVLDDAKAVSVCASVRIAPEAHEAGVDTHRDFRRRGYAARAARAWARAVREMDRIPLYSTSWENGSSRVLAKRLGLIQYGATLHIT
ncbi:MAG: GNAT family N-acetyltransferase [Gemmatimonadaceae bacterium]